MNLSGLSLLRRVGVVVFVSLMLCCERSGAEPPTPPDLSAYQSEIASWRDDIERLTTADTPGEADVLLVGSSSIRLWESAAEDLAPYRVVRRGFGGAKYSDVAFYIDRLAGGVDFRAVVLFVGNDISGSDADKTPAEVGRLFGYVADRLRHTNPKCIVICVDVRPTPSRFAAWPAIAAGNAALRAACEERERVYYLDTAEVFLTEDGAAVREELYGPDRLHLSDAGYSVWRSLIRDELDRRLAPPNAE